MKKKIDKCTLNYLTELLVENRNRREIAAIKKQIATLMKENEVFVSEKHKLVFEKSKGKLIVKALITKKGEKNDYY